MDYEKERERLILGSDGLEQFLREHDARLIEELLSSLTFVDNPMEASGKLEGEDALIAYGWMQKGNAVIRWLRQQSEEIRG